MPEKALVDAGPLVALFDRDDRHHPQSLKFIKAARDELLTTLAVMTEVCYLLDFSVKAQTDFLAWASKGALTLIEVTSDDLTRIVTLTTKYADLPMDFADSTLVAIAERLGLDRIVTVDSDFDIYRLKGRKPFRNIFLDA